MAEDTPALSIDGEKPRRRPSRGMYVLPSLFTAGNIAAGYYAITQAIQGSVADPAFFDRAALAIGFAVLFDGLDGQVARRTRTTSDFGKELDSLADVITFGVAPSLLAYMWGFRLLPLTVHPLMRDRILHLGVFVCFLFLICGACRLARFNISVNPQPRNPGRPGKKYFVGMPIPAGAGVIASVIHFFNGAPIYNPYKSMLWLGLILGTGFLMVSSWRFWSGKEISTGGRHPFQLVVVLVLVLGLLLLYSEWMLILLALGYLVSGVIARLAYSWSRKHRQATMPGETQI
ncbi:CDP-diacylglycerol--serine O-phosphatidyltransferase [Granulicella arctica]|uniref:CDP-diacylglycerol--serine O-phosphatidyltransferase n=1 Tax=Granulicella arctica TaxID=940613 RepID=A0A7Y9TGE1_9BACT|nr:CDP-diacylglycerol--serine O-phosphatidyltransferase [Granulicella arctica]NYF79811.1 CDP-diacylglycerol--serine O-phosphatidyltransferase [Granulicella arctica]